jgi:hypothetical protein
MYLVLDCGSDNAQADVLYFDNHLFFITPILKYQTSVSSFFVGTIVTLDNLNNAHLLYLLVTLVIHSNQQA